MEAIIAKYIEIWTTYYSNIPCACVKTAASYATMDCVNDGKRGGFSEAEYWDDIAYWMEKIKKL